jgi:hypothetical protein
MNGKLGKEAKFCGLSQVSRGFATRKPTPHGGTQNSLDFFSSQVPNPAQNETDTSTLPIPFAPDDTPCLGNEQIEFALIGCAKRADKFWRGARSTMIHAGQIGLCADCLAPRRFGEVTISNRASGDNRSGHLESETYPHVTRRAEDTSSNRTRSRLPTNVATQSTRLVLRRGDERVLITANARKYLALTVIS